MRRPSLHGRTCSGPCAAHLPGLTRELAFAATHEGCAVGWKLPGAAHCPLWKRSHNNATQHAPRRKSAKNVSWFTFLHRVDLDQWTCRNRPAQWRPVRHGAPSIDAARGASGGSSTDPTGTGSAGNCHWGAAAAQVPTGSGRRLRLRGWGRNRPPLSEWGSSITTSSHFPLNVGKSL